MGGSDSDWLLAEYHLDMVRIFFSSDYELDIADYNSHQIRILVSSRSVVQERNPSLGTLSHEVSGQMDYEARKNRRIRSIVRNVYYLDISEWFLDILILNRVLFGYFFVLTDRSVVRRRDPSLGRLSRGVSGQMGYDACDVSGWSFPYIGQSVHYTTQRLPRT